MGGRGLCGTQMHAPLAPDLRASAAPREGGPLLDADASRELGPRVDTIPSAGSKRGPGPSERPSRVCACGQVSGTPPGWSASPECGMRRPLQGGAPVCTEGGRSGPR